MSKIKLPHASGNSMSIAAPATNPASDLELKLPATIGTANQYLKNSSTPGTLEFGSLSAGKVLQVKTGTKTGTQSIGGGSYSDVGGMTATITPASTDSRILIIIALGRMNGSTDSAGFKIVRTPSGGSAIDVGIGDAASNRPRVSFMATRWDISASHGTGLSYSWLDHPNSTTAQAYKLQCFPQGDYWQINRNEQYFDGSDIYHAVAASHFTLIEVSDLS